MDARISNFVAEATANEEMARAGIEAKSPFCLLCKNTNPDAFKNCTGACNALKDYVAVIK
jgi:hypothetical protein